MGQYSKKMYDAVAKADMGNIGVRLGAACIDAQIPVQVVAKWMGTTRQGVYYWFTGATDVSAAKRKRVELITSVLITAANAGALPVDDLPTALAIFKKYRGEHNETA